MISCCLFASHWIAHMCKWLLGWGALWYSVSINNTLGILCLHQWTLHCHMGESQVVCSERYFTLQHKKLHKNQVCVNWLTHLHASAAHALISLQSKWPKNWVHCSVRTLYIHCCPSTQSETHNGTAVWAPYVNLFDHTRDIEMKVKQVHVILCTCWVLSLTAGLSYIVVLSWTVGRAAVSCEPAICCETGVLFSKLASSKWHNLLRWEVLF